MISGCVAAAMASLAELIEQCLLLLCAEALHPAVVGDADVFHDLAGLDLADAGSDSSSDTTLSLPTFVSSDASASDRLIEPIFSGP